MKLPCCLLGAITICAAQTLPLAISVSPSTGTGSEQVFTATYQGTGLEVGYFLVSNSPDNRQLACFMQYNFRTGIFYLANDDASAWTTVTGGSGSTANSQCTLRGYGSSGTISGSAGTVKFSLAFTSKFSGTKGLYLRAANSDGSASGYESRGSYVVMIPSSPPPTTVSVSPSTGSGSEQVFTATYQGTDLEVGYLLISNAADNRQLACFVQYNFRTAEFYLANDMASAWTKVKSGTGSTANSRCTLRGNGSSGSLTGGTGTAKFSLAFTSKFDGVKGLYLRSASSSGLASGYDPRGIYIVAVPPPVRPITISVSPVNGTGSEQVFTAKYQGAGLEVGYLLVSSDGQNLRSACLLQYNFRTHAFYLANDEASAWTTTTAGSGSLSNTQCTLQGSGSSGAIVGVDGTVRFSLKMAGGFAGTKGLYLRAVNSEGLPNAAGYERRGYYTVAPLEPAATFTMSAASLSVSGVVTMTVLSSSNRNTCRATWTAACSLPAKAGDTVMFSAHASPLGSFDGWAIGNDCSKSQSSSVSFQVDRNRACAALFH